MAGEVGRAKSVVHFSSCRKGAIAIIPVPIVLTERFHEIGSWNHAVRNLQDAMTL